MSSYSAGLLKIDTLNVPGASSSLSARTINVNGTVNASAITATTFGYNSLDLSGNLRVRDTITVGPTAATVSSDASGNLLLDSIITSAAPKVVADASGTLSELTSVVRNNVVGYLAGKTYAVYYNDFLDSYLGNGGILTTSSITYQFNNDQTVSSTSNNNGGTYGFCSSSDKSGVVNTPYTILSAPTPSKGAVIQFIWSNISGSYSYNRYVTMTFSPDFKYITTFQDTLPPLTLARINAIKSVTNSISTSGLNAGNFNARLVSSYATNATGIVDDSGNRIYLVDSSGGISQYSNGDGVLSGTVDAASIFTRFGSVLNDETKTALNTALLAASKDEMTKYGQDTRKVPNIYEIMSTFLINNRAVTPVTQKVSSMSDYRNPLYNGNATYTGVLINCDFATGAPECSVPYHDNANIYIMDMSGHNFDKRLNGTSYNSNFEPSESEFEGHACLFREQAVDASGDKYLKNIAVRGMDTVLIHHRQFLDPAEAYYISGRTITYARHHLGILNDTFWYPDGPEINFNLSNRLSVSKVVINDVEIPIVIVQRRSIDSVVVKDNEKVFINIADAIAGTSELTINYVTDASGNYNTVADSSGVYTEGGLNKIEVWYQGTLSYSNNGAAKVFWNPSSKGVFKSPTVTEMNNLNIIKTLEYNKTLDASGYFPITYPKYSIARTRYPLVDASSATIQYVDLSSNGGFFLNTERMADFHSEVTDSNIDIEVSDPAEDELRYLLPISDTIYDQFYLQFEIMCPGNFYAHSGGTNLPVVNSPDGKYKLFRYVPGAKVSGDDYRSYYGTAFKFMIDTHPWVDAGYVDTSGGSHVRIYSGISQTAYNIVESDPELRVPNLITKTGILNMLNAIEAFLGPYPFDTFAFGFGMYNGMEHFEAITQRTMEQYVVIHEAIHQWWQNGITNFSNKVAWIDEGFNQGLGEYVNDVLFGAGKNSQYYWVISRWITEVSQGLGTLSIRDDYGFSGEGSYNRGGYIFNILGYNWGAPLAVDTLTGKNTVRLLDSSNNLVMNISNSGGAVIGVYAGSMESFSEEFDYGALNTAIIGFSTGFNRKMYDLSGNVFYITSGYKILDQSGNDTTNTAAYATGLLDSSNVVWNTSNDTVVSYTPLTLPRTGGLTQYFRTFDSSGNLNLNTNYWDAVKYVQNQFKGNTKPSYTYETFVEAWAVYAEANSSSWGGLWPSTKQHIYDFFNELCNTGANLDLSAVYRVALDNGPGGLLPSSINPSSYSKVPTVVRFNGKDYVGNKFGFSYGINKAFNVSAPTAWLTSNGLNPLFGADVSDYIASAAYYGGGFTWVGKIAFVSRGSGTFAVKLYAATLAGCAGLIIYNNVPGLNSGGVFAVYPITIPGVTLSQADAVEIIALCLASPTKTVPGLLSGVFPVAS
jgi:hypothetical protein